MAVFKEPGISENRLRGRRRKREKDSWNMILDIGDQIVPDTSQQKRVQKCFTVQGTKREAERTLAELLQSLHRGEYVEPSKLTVGDWRAAWLETAMQPPIYASGPTRPLRVSSNAT